jgi:ubiquinone/menaquinone biosynthesis C-methylase UbiE
MGVSIDPEGTETRVLHDLVDFAGKEVVEVGCGDGRMSWRYAEVTRSVLALDPNEDRIQEARERTPDALKPTVTFRVGDVQSVGLPDEGGDVAILSGPCDELSVRVSVAL